MEVWFVKVFLSSPGTLAYTNLIAYSALALVGVAMIVLSLNQAFLLLYEVCEVTVENSSVDLEFVYFGRRRYKCPLQGVTRRVNLFRCDSAKGFDVAIEITQSFFCRIVLSEKLSDAALFGNSGRGVRS